MAADPVEDREADDRIAALARELATAIKEERRGGRSELRDYAIDVLRESVAEDPSEAPTAHPTAAAAAPLNPFGLGIPLLLAGAVLAAIFPPVGLLLLAGGLIACTTGVMMALFGARRRARMGKATTDESETPEGGCSMEQKR